MSIDVLTLAPLPNFLAQPLEAAYTRHDYAGGSSREGLIAEAGGKIRAVVGLGGTVYHQELLARLPALEIISVFGVGYDGVPLDYCRARGIRVTNTPDVLTDDVADVAVALVLMCSREFVRANRHLHAGEWQDRPYRLTRALRGKTAGILGLGRIGKAIAHRLTAFGMQIAYHGRRAQDAPYRFFDSLTGMAAAADFLVVACPGGAETHHLVDAGVLAALGPQGTLVNIARGSIVDEPALITALQSGVIKGAGLDVFENEPHIPAELLAIDNAVLLPHVGSATHETRREMARLVVENLAAHFGGRPLVTPVV